MSLLHIPSCSPKLFTYSASTIHTSARISHLQIRLYSSSHLSQLPIPSYPAQSLCKLTHFLPYLTTSQLNTPPTHASTVVLVSPPHSSVSPPLALSVSSAAPKEPPNKLTFPNHFPAEYFSPTRVCVLPVSNINK